jgi:TrbL/VirB6 plasmid conjugal transfer protein
MRKFLWLMPLVTVAAARAQSSPTIPINSGSVDYVSMVTSGIDNLVAADSPVFLAMGNQLLTAIGITMLVIYGLKWALHSASRHHPEFDFPGVIHFFALFLVAEMMMRYYNTPLPWTSSSFHQLLPDTGRQLAGIIDLSSLNTLLTAINDATHQAQKPDNDFLMVFVYVCVLIDMVLVEGALFAVTILGFIAIGIGSLLGPLFIPWLIVPRVSWLFWNWIQFMLQYSFYRVVSSALVYVWANAIVRFFTNSIQHNYSLPHLLLLIVPFGILNIGLFFSIFKITSFVSDLFKGTAAAGSGMVGNMAGVIRGAFA